MRIAMIFLLGLLGVTRFVHAEPAAEVMGEMAKVAWMAGEWAGDGWAMTPAGRMNFRVHEVVESKLDGQVLFIEGKGIDPNDATKVVHHAVGVMSHDSQAGRFQFRAFRAGNTVDADIDVVDGKIIWGFEVPGRGRVRYTLELTADGKWFETGEFTMDGGKTWMKILEMTLSRQ